MPIKRRYFIKYSILLSLSFLWYFITSCLSSKRIKFTEERKDNNRKVLNQFIDKRRKEESPSLVAGSYKVKITPKLQVFLAGTRGNRRNSSVHDDLYARCLVLDNGYKTIIFVSLDILGLFFDDIEDIRNIVGSEARDDIIISSTHNHSGPDTLGYWGRYLLDILPISSGRDEQYIADLKTKIVECLEKAVLNCKPATVGFGIGEIDGVSKNIRDNKILDREINIMHVKELNGSNTIGTLVNFACHPEILALGDNNEITADFPGYLCDYLDTQIGGITLFINGAIGGMVTADIKENTYEEAKRIGETIAINVKDLILKGGLSYKEYPVINMMRQYIYIPLNNWRFELAKYLGIFKRKLYLGRTVKTEVVFINIASAQFITLPGELFPRLGLNLKKDMGGRHCFILGLTSDELGYIMAEEDERDERYSYEQSMSLSPGIGNILLDNIRLMLKAASI